MPTLSREALYELVWQDPVRTVAASFGVSDVWLKKLCEKISVPVPQRGYWAKLQAGKPVVRLPLPQWEPGQSDRIEIGREAHSWRWNPEAELAEPIPPPPEFPEPIEAVAARVVKRVGKVPFVRTLESPWGAIRKLLEGDERRREKQRGATYTFSWELPLFDSPFERRRLRILNSLCLGLSKAGAKPQVVDKEARNLGVVVGSQTVGFTLDHPDAKPDQHGRPTTRQGPADTLRLEVRPLHDEGGFERVFCDRDDATLESQLTDIVIALIVAGEARYRAAQHAHHAWLLKRRIENQAEVERRRAEAERKARERREKEERERRELLFAQAADWRTAQDIRSFVAEVLRDPTRRADGKLQRWAAWARAEADALDPLRQRKLVPPPPSGAAGQS